MTDDSRRALSSASPEVRRLYRALCDALRLSALWLMLRFSPLCGKQLTLCRVQEFFARNFSFNYGIDADLTELAALT